MMPICAASYYEGGRCSRAGQELALNEFINNHGKQLKLCRDCRETRHNRIKSYFESTEEFEKQYEPDNDMISSDTFPCPKCGMPTHIRTSKTAGGRYRACSRKNGCGYFFRTDIVDGKEVVPMEKKASSDSATELMELHRKDRTIALLRWALLAIEDDKKREMALEALDRILKNE